MEDVEIINLFLRREERAISETKNKYGIYCYTIAQNILTIKEDVEECIKQQLAR